MTIEVYDKITKELEELATSPVPAHPTVADFNRVQEMRDTLKAMDAVKLGINKDELRGAILLAEARMVDLVHAKR